jgi:hypothetical protein
MGCNNKYENMNRCFLIVLVVLGAATESRAQLLGGFFDQGATELKEYTAQIAALQLYIHKAQRGYRIAETGLTDIGNIHRAEYDLHQAYFGSLAAVNPKIAGMPEVGEIIKLRSVMGQAGDADVDELADVLTPGKLVMTDDQRMGRIRMLDSDMKRRFAAMQELSVQRSVLIGQRQAAAVGAMQQLYGVH